MTEYGMHVVHDGARQAPPLLLIHGSGATGDTWQPVVPALAAHHHVIRIDLPGCGRSPAPRSFAVPVQAARLAALLDGLGLSAVAVAGHSSGGYVATALAEQRPDLVGSLSLLSTGPALDALRPEPAVLKFLLAPPFGPLFYALRTPATIRKALLSTCARPVDVPEEMIAGLRGTPYRSFRQVMLANRAYLAERSVPDRLARLDRPVQVVFGAADPRWDPQSAHRYETVPGAQLDWLPGAGHLVMLEAPEPVAELLLSFTAVRR